MPVLKAVYFVQGSHGLKMTMICPCYEPELMNTISTTYAVSSIVYWGYLDNFEPVYLFIYLFIFEEKILRAQKHDRSENQRTKQK